MSHQPSDNPKRRGPDESAKHDQQDADWGFESDEEGLGIEKKLGLILVLCLLAGFSFVFYQKYRILQRETAQAENDPPVADDSGDSDTLAESPPVDIKPTPAGKSPFYEPPTEPTPTPVNDDQWILTSEETSGTSATDSVASGTSHQRAPDTFDPFADQQGMVPPAEETLSTPASAPTVTWNEDQLPSAPPPEEFVPFEWEETTDEVGQPRSTGGPSPLPALESTVADAPLQTPEPQPVEDPPILEFAAPAEPKPLSTEESSPLVIDSDTTETESASVSTPQSMVPVPDGTLAQEDVSAPEAGFDPFLSDAPAAPEPANASATEVPPFPAPDAVAASIEPATDPPVSSETPAWPFAEAEEASAPPQSWDSQPPAEEPQAFTEAPSLSLEPADETGPSDAVDIQQQPSSHSPSANPFVADAGGQRKIPAIVAAQAVIGEREIVVSQSDSFWSISEREYGTSRYFSALARYNRDRVPLPEKLQSGISIRVPPPEVLEAQFPDLLPSRKPPQGTITPTGGSTSDAGPSGLFYDEREQPRYQVGQRDTLSTIAQAHLGRASRWTEIYELNRDQLSSPSTLKIGMVLKLPAETSGAIVWPVHDFSR